MAGETLKCSKLQKIEELAYNSLEVQCNGINTLLFINK